MYSPPLVEMSNITVLNEEAPFGEREHHHSRYVAAKNLCPGFGPVQRETTVLDVLQGTSDNCSGETKVQ